jgi:Asp-tRNA(Asn)/Glu-tRNA(Gln) amidotransferase A subunit family amidase
MTFVPSGFPTDRRRFLALCSAAGAGGGLFPGVLWARMDGEPEITEATIREAEVLAGLDFTPEQRAMMLQGLRTQRDRYLALREVEIPNSVPPALHFDPVPPGMNLPAGPSRVTPSVPAELPGAGEAVSLAYASLSELGALLRSGRVTSVQLTRLALDRLRRHDRELECVVTLLEERAMAQAESADDALARGEDRGPLHGIPWGAKDLLAVSGAPTTWGAMPYRDQHLDDDATAVRRLDEAGAVLVAKLTLGALAQGDVWFGGRTRSPWDLEQGSSGSSAGSAAAVAAGLVPFAIGSETLGSIVSPASRCGVTGLRPTFGAVSRHGAMALSWSMDKLGPLTRSVEDAVLVFQAIRGPDGRDPTVREAAFQWDGPELSRRLGPPATEGPRVPEGLRVGILEGGWESEGEEGELDRAALAALRALGVDPTPVSLPSTVPLASLRSILTAEAAAAFDDLTRSGRDELLVSQGPGAWPNTFRTARFIPAVEYIQANRARSLLMEEMDRLFQQIDVLVAPSFATDLLLSTNLTGHPAVVVPSGFRRDGTPVSLTFVSGLFREADAARLAFLWQATTPHHRARPPRFS